MRPSPRLGAGIRLAVLLLALVLGGAACGDGDGGDGDVGLDDGDIDATTAPASEATTAPASEATTDATSEPTTDARADDNGPEELFPDVVGATAERAGDGSWTFSATLSSPYDTPERYADAWRVLGPDGEVYGIRELTHDHANEQPFTRSQSGIVIPEGVTTVTVQGRDQVSGWGGATVEVELEPSP